MPSFRYRALTQSGEVVSGSISAPTAAEVSHRMNYLRLVPIDNIVAEDPAWASRFKFGRRARPEDVTIFTRDLALLLKAGSRLDAALDLLATDVDIGRLRPTIAAIRASVLSGESFADALLRHPISFSPMYVALVRVGETSGTLDHILDLLATERTRSEALRRKLADALRYPIFLLFAATGVLIFFLMFVMPQFDAVLHDFNAKLDPAIVFFLGLSQVLNAHATLFGLLAVIVLTGSFFIFRQPSLRAAMMARVSRLPIIRLVYAYHVTALFCRNLSVLLTAAVPLTTALRILSDMMGTMGNAAVWTHMVERVRHGGKLSDALGEIKLMPAMAARMLRLGEETGQLPVLAARVAEFYETKLQRSLDRVVGVIGPLAIIAISTVVGGLIASVMTSLLSVSQSIG